MRSNLAFFIGTSICLVSILGCTTPYDLKKTKPKVSYVTTRPAKDVMKCILDKWKAHQPTVYEEKTSDGWIIRHDDASPSATVAIVTVEGTQPAVTVNYYHRTNRIKLHRLEEDTVDCK